jgi:hypothetical protein
MESWEHKLSVKAEGTEKEEIAISADLNGLNLDNFVIRGLKDFAANLAKVVRDGLKTPAEFAEMFQESVEKYSRGETARREGGVARVDTAETLAIRILASVLKDKAASDSLATAKVPVPRLDDPPKTEKGTVNYNAWAKVLRDEEHPWFAAAKKQAEQKKGFD